jgi:hypothetical protein
MRHPLTVEVTAAETMEVAALLAAATVVAVLEAQAAPIQLVMWLTPLSMTWSRQWYSQFRTLSRSYYPVCPVSSTVRK